MKIAVTGATGHIGSNLVPMLLEQRHMLKLLIYHSNRYNDVDNIEIVRGDITHEQDVDQLVEGADAVIHLAAKITIEQDRDGSVTRINVDGTRHVVESCLKHGIKRLIHFSSIHAFDPHPRYEPLDETRGFSQNATYYDASKIAAEKLVLEAMERGLEAVILCPTSVFGVNDYQPSLLGSAIVDIYNGKVPMLTPGGYDFVFVQEVAQATVEALTRDVAGEKYLLGGGYLTVKELASLVGKAGKVKVSQRVLPAAFLRALVPIFKLQSLLSGKPAIFTKESLKALTEGNTHVNCAKAQKDLGFQPTPMEEAMKRTLEWFEGQGALKER